MTPAGLGMSCLIPLMEAGFVDWVISTGEGAIDNAGTPDNTRHAFGVGGRVGFGLEWFPKPKPINSLDVV